MVIIENSTQIFFILFVLCVYMVSLKEKLKLQLPKCGKQLLKMDILEKNNLIKSLSATEIFKKNNNYYKSRP